MNIDRLNFWTKLAIDYVLDNFNPFWGASKAPSEKNALLKLFSDFIQKPIDFFEAKMATIF